MELIRLSLELLNEAADPVELISRVVGKEYISYAVRSGVKTLSSPVNKALFIPNFKTVDAHWQAWRAGEHRDGLSQLTYTMATSFRAASELLDRNNKKGPATFFEILVGHLVARAVGGVPKKEKVKLPIERRNVRLTMDFLLDLGAGRPKIHMPVKLSTRERIVQAWAHQRLLDSAFGSDTYRGVLVVLSETKLDNTKREVVEICVPEQWLAYQTYLARMERIYFFDVPAKYAALAEDFPVFKVKQFAEFFREKEVVLGPPPGPSA